MVVIECGRMVLARVVKAIIYILVTLNSRALLNYRWLFTDEFWLETMLRQFRGTPLLREGLNETQLTET